MKYKIISLVLCFYVEQHGHILTKSIEDVSGTKHIKQFTSELLNLRLALKTQVFKWAEMMLHNFVIKSVYEIYDDVNYTWDAEHDWKET